MKQSRYQIPGFDQEYGHLLDQLTGIMDVLHEGICISNSEGVIIKMNPMYTRLAGVSPEAMLGKKVSFLNSKEGIFDAPEPNAELVQQEKGYFKGPVSPVILRTKKPANGIQRRKGGEWNLLHGYPLFDEKGDVAMVVTFVRDISHLTLFSEQQMAYHKDIYDHFRKTINVIDSDQSNSTELIIKSPKMESLWAQMKKVAQTDATVLVLGETGVGKGEIARQIHSMSRRCREVFFKADCASIPDNLIESEFFGYSKGAFSGANQEGKDGYFSAAEDGSIFLDEIGELPIMMQSKLLRVLQDQEIMQLGSLKPKKVDVRVIAATNVDLDKAVEDGDFRQDLYYRLNVSVLRVPPLRERVEDIMPLAQFFLKRYNMKYRRKIGFSEEASLLLLQHGWPGNVRELKNMIQGIVINCETDVIEPDDLPRAVHRNAQKHCADSLVYSDVDVAGKTLKQITAKIERDILQRAFKEYGSLSKVGKLFKIDRTTVARKLKK